MFDPNYEDRAEGWLYRNLFNLAGDTGRRTPREQTLCMLSFQSSNY
jgi:hypothetical protein